MEKGLWVPTSERKRWDKLPGSMRPSRKRRDGRDLLPKTVIGDDAVTNHSHEEADITDLGSYSSVGHSHLEADVTDLAHYNDPLTTKGDLMGFNTDAARIPVGTDGHVLTADSAQALGVKWAAAAGGGGADDRVIHKASTVPTTGHANDYEVSGVTDTTDPVTDESWVVYKSTSQASAEVYDGSAQIIHTGSTGSTSAYGVAAAPTGDFTTECLFRVAATADASMTAGFVLLWDTGAGASDWAWAGWTHYSSQPYGSAAQYRTSSPGSAPTLAATYSVVGWGQPYYRLVWTSSAETVHFEYSLDGRTWARLEAAAGTDAVVTMTGKGDPDHVGFIMGTSSAYSHPILRFEWIRFNWDYGN